MFPVFSDFEHVYCFQCRAPVSGPFQASGYAAALREIAGCTDDATTLVGAPNGGRVTRDPISRIEGEGLVTTLERLGYRASLTPDPRDRTRVWLYVVAT